jgi:carbamoyl-phosphate synthase large subunit
MIKVAVTGAGAVLGQGIIKSLKASRLDCEIVAFDPHPLSVGLYWADRAGLIPLASETAYKDAIENMLERERPDVVLIGTDVELAIFARYRQQWEERFSTHIIVSDENVVEIADDKFQTAQFLDAHGLSHPESVLPEDDEALEALIARHGFPLIVKPRRGARAIGLSLVTDRDELAAAIKGRQGLVVQQLAGPDHEEYTAGVLYFDGAAQASIIMRRDLRDGNTYRAYVDDFPEWHGYVRDIANALKPHGPANFQFRVGEDGTPRLFEINARFSGTTPMRAIAGFNEVEMCLLKILDGETIVQPELRKGVILRYLQEQFVDQADTRKIAAA